MSHNLRLIAPTSINTRSLSSKDQKHIIETYTYDNNGNRASATVHEDTIGENHERAEQILTR